MFRDYFVLITCSHVLSTLVITLSHSHTTHIHTLTCTRIHTHTHSLTHTHTHTRYTRNLVDTGNENYNLIVICWGEGHGR